jgi:hypothetical protein
MNANWAFKAFFECVLVDRLYHFDGSVWKTFRGNCHAHGWLQRPRELAAPREGRPHRRAVYIQVFLITNAIVGLDTRFIRPVRRFSAGLRGAGQKEAGLTG